MSGSITNRDDNERDDEGPMIQDHLLIYQPLTTTCNQGHEVTRWYGSNQAYCSCGGFEIAAKHREDIELAHDAHMQAAQRRQEQTFIRQHTLDVNRHTLRFRGPNAANCDWCNWQVYGMDASRIREAFSNHLETIRKASATAGSSEATLETVNP